ncbi:MAG TPA: hypothetical protein VJU78_03775 [Chitinophagaceae bacterium]|nr:hypothetical protein [Chitinophagaceae bacterium]
MTNFEKQIADKIAKANGLSVTKLGLHFDKVVVRLFEGLRVSVERVIPKGMTVIVTVTAPIKLPAKTEQEIEGIIKDFLDSGIRQQDRKVTVCQNEVRLRIVESSPKRADKFVGLVHNPGTDAKLLLDLATQWLLEN